uniref:Uncharacterized protein n=1 Tax=Opuntia streptacantha TaxID=393608 RepID=A0A7C9B2Y1_OPUST
MSRCMISSRLSSESSSFMILSRVSRTSPLPRPPDELPAPSLFSMISANTSFNLFPYPINCRFTLILLMNPTRGKQSAKFGFPISTIMFQTSSLNSPDAAEL